MLPDESKNTNQDVHHESKKVKRSKYMLLPFLFVLFFLGFILYYASQISKALGG